jgi:predicted RNA-binding Zn-ribbon protein involved in translation (DUF1610 family)
VCEAADACERHALGTNNGWKEMSETSGTFTIPSDSPAAKYYKEAVGYLMNGLCPNCDNHPILIRGKTFKEKLKNYRDRKIYCPQCGFIVNGK